MDAKFDPYAEWLGIQSAERPVNHYDLLGLARFESEPSLINEAALARSSTVRKYQLGIHSDLSQRILNEISAARVCLLDPDKRQAYDAKLLAAESDDDIPVAQLASPLEPIVPLQPAAPLPPGASHWANRQPEPTPLSGPLLIAVIAVPLVVLLGLGVMVVGSWMGRKESGGNGPIPVAVVPSKPMPKPPTPSPQPVPPTSIVEPPAPPTVTPIGQHPTGKRVNYPTNGHDYQRIEKAMSWHEARDYCKSLGGYLATATSPSENQFIYDNFGQDKVVWLGATDETRNGDWKWVTGEPWGFNNWARGEPSNYGNKEHYVAMGNCPGVQFMGQSFFYRFGPSWNDHEDSGDFWHTLICYPVCEWDKGAPAKVTPPVAVVPNSTMPPATSSAMTGTMPGEERKFGELGLVFCWCPAGKFPMGSPKSDPDRKPEESESHEATISHGYWISQTEVTKQVWRDVAKFEPWKGRVGVIEDANSAACFLSCFDAKGFCSSLTARDRRSATNPLPAGWEYRLPNEVEWEYACRAESTSLYSFGNRQTDLKHYAWYEGNARSAGEDFAHVVGLKKANAWNLLDMTGNVAEWCSETEDRRLKQPNAPKQNVARGGHWLSQAEQCRSAMRFLVSDDLNLRPPTFGMRIVLSPANLPADSIRHGMPSN